jgi:conjugative transfer region protein TrbK
MMKAGSILVLAMSLAACDRQQATSSPSPATAASTVTSDQERCARGGVEAANDPRCKATSDARFRKFIGGGDEHRSR